jgi:hypothetical protein
MYTFQPLASIPVDHIGFGLVVGFCGFWLLVCLFNETEAFFGYLFITTIACGIAYGVSYHWTNQEPKTFVNEQHVGKFVGFQPEGYNERSGKTRADRHYMYVVYEVEGQLTIMQTGVGMTYPKEVLLYKN